jgi:hypothetical protein
MLVILKTNLAGAKAVVAAAAAATTTTITSLSRRWSTDCNK